MAIGDNEKRGGASEQGIAHVAGRIWKRSLLGGSGGLHSRLIMGVIGVTVYGLWGLLTYLLGPPDPPRTGRRVGAKMACGRSRRSSGRLGRLGAGPDDREGGTPQGMCAIMAKQVDKRMEWEMETGFM